MILKTMNTLLILLLATVAFGQEGDFTINGKIAKSNDDRFIKLYYQHDTIKVVDSVRVENGRFTFRGQLTAPTLGNLSFDKADQGDRIDLFLSQGAIDVQSNDSLGHAKITGTVLTEAHERLAIKIRPVEQALFDRFNYYRAMPEGEAKKAYLEKLMVELDEYGRLKRETIHQFVVENPDSYVALYHLDKTAPGRVANYETTYPFYTKLSQEIKDTPLGKRLESRLQAVKGGLTGQQYKDFISQTPAGEELSLKEIISKNSYTLVDFWASWCGPCRKENPHVVKTYEAFKDSGFTVLSVSLDNDKKKWEEAIEKDGMPWYHVSSLQGWKEPAALLYGVRAIPQNVLVDGQGKIIATNLRGETLFNKIQELVN